MVPDPSIADIGASYRAAMAFFSAGSFGEARRLLRQCVGESPADGDVWAGIAAAYLTEGHDDGALRAYQRAHLLKPDDLDISEVVAQLALSRASPDLLTAIRGSRHLVSPKPEIADLWAQAAIRYARDQQAEAAQAAAWEAQRLAWPDFDSGPTRACRALAGVDFDAPALDNSEAALAERGYAVVNGASLAQVDAMRRDALASNVPVAGMTPPNMLQQIPTLVDVILQPKVIELLRVWLGKPILVAPSVTAATEFHTGWHTDATLMPKGGRTFDQGQAALVLTMLLYLQDNRPFSGGGLSVVPGSHRSLEDTVVGDERIIATRAGDLLFFDARLFHRGSRRLLNALDPRPKVMFSLVWAASTEGGRQYMDAYVHRPNVQATSLSPRFVRDLEGRCAALGVDLFH